MDTLLAIAHAECVAEVWAPDLDNAHLKDAALGLGSLATTPRPPAEIPWPYPMTFLRRKTR